MIKAPPSHLDLMQMHVRVLFKHDENQRLTVVNQWNGGTVPRFFLGRTLKGNVWRFHKDLPDTLVNDLSALCLKESATLLDEPEFKAKYLELLSSHAEINHVWQGPAYYGAKALTSPSNTVAITEANTGLLRSSLKDWIPDVPYWQPFMVSVEDGQAVAVCATVRSIAEAAEAGVETAASYRRKGHAANAVASWVNALLEKNLIPLYSTSWGNKASQGIAKKLDFSLYGTDFHIT